MMKRIIIGALFLGAIGLTYSLARNDTIILKIRRLEKEVVSLILIIMAFVIITKNALAGRLTLMKKILKGKLIVAMAQAIL